MGTLAASRKSIENFIKSEKSVEITDKGGKSYAKSTEARIFMRPKLLNDLEKFSHQKYFKYLRFSLNQASLLFSYEVLDPNRPI